MQWGTVQVTIVVKGKRITDLRATYPSERPRSAYINKQAIPWLRSEALAGAEREYRPHLRGHHDE